ncbi:MAG: zinc ribbon domain-containing protein [Verrucomicrobia bacterium]|nr:zinc ribbon domain-containing protein [Verrucomicrobiota bacterium]
MPTYEYACPKCGHTFEMVQSMRDDPLKKCPSCKKAGVKRLVGKGEGLIFKGTGFYITDYKLKGMNRKEGGEDAKPKESKPAGSESKPSGSESKPAASESKPGASESKPGEPKSSSSSPVKPAGKSSKN